MAKQAAARGARERIGTIWADWGARSVEIDFAQAFFARPLDEQAEAARALIEAAVGEHIDVQDARIDATTAEPADGAPDGDMAG